MGIFDAFRKKGIIIVSPMRGTCVSMKEVSDPTFSEEILGRGVAIKPVEGKVYSPADGMITTMFPTGHAVGITTDEGVELLVHVGLDTVAMKGDGFNIIAKEGQRVRKGDLLIDADLEKIEKAGYDTITPVVICNSDDYIEINVNTDNKVGAGDVIVELKK